MRIDAFHKLFFACAMLVFVGAGCSSVVDGGIFVSDDNGRTWTQRVFVAQEGRRASTISALNIEDIVVHPENDQIVYIASRAGGVWKTENGGEQWRKLAIREERIRDIAIDPVNPDTLFIVRGSTILKSTDGGEGWEIVFTDSQQSIITRVEVDWFNPDRIYAVTSIGTVLTSDDEGLTWKVVHQVDEPIIGLLMSQDDSRTLYIVELDKNVHKTTDGGTTWEPLFDSEQTRTLKESDDVKSVYMDPNNSATLYAVTDYGLMRTTDAGATWNPITTLIEFGADQNGQMTAVAVEPGNSNHLSFAVGRILHVSDDAGITWETFETFPSQRRITDYAYVGPNSDRIYSGVQEIEEERRGFLPTPQ